MPEAARRESLPIPDSASTRSALFSISELLTQRGLHFDHPDRKHIQDAQFRDLAIQLLWNRNLASVPALLAAGLLTEGAEITVTNGIEQFRRQSPASESDLNRLLYHAKNINIQGGKLIFPSENPEDPPLVGDIGLNGHTESSAVFTPNPAYSRNIQSVYGENQTPFSIAFAPMWLGDAQPLFNTRK